MQKILPGERVTIVVDVRELYSQVVCELHALECEIVEKRLAVGDYVCSERVCVERKTAEDFTASVIDGRLFEQLAKMKESYEKPVLIIEGRNFFSRNIHPNAVYGAIAGCVELGASVLHSSNPRETARIIYFLAKKEQINQKRGVVFKPRVKPKTLSELQLTLVAGLPFVNATLARRLLERFKTPRAVFTASERALKKVEGIGEKKAKAIWKVLNKEWEEV